MAKKPAVQGLRNAMQPELDDPLGTNRKLAGRDAYMESMRQSNPNYMSGPLPDPEWLGYGTALADEGVTRFAADAPRPHGIADNPAWAAQGANPEEAIDGGPLMKSNNLAGLDGDQGALIQRLARAARAARTAVAPKVGL